MEKVYIIKKQGDKWVILSEDGSKKLGEFDSEEAAKKRLAQIEFWKRQKGHEALEFESDLTSINGVDIFAVGTWRGVNSPKEGDKYSLSDLHEMVDAFNAGVMTPRIKLTHGSDDDQPEIGKVANLRVEGNKLKGDFVDMPRSLRDFMQRSGAFARRSAEIIWGMKDKAGKAWSRVLKAVALLAPGQKPAVDALGEGYQFEALYSYQVSEWMLEEEGIELTYAEVMFQGTEHACRLTEPGQYKQFRRKNAAQKHGGKAIDVIYGIKTKGGERKSELQALRYPADTWTPDAARAHCASRGGKFDAGTSAKHTKGGDIMDEQTKGLLAKYGLETLEELEAKIKADGEKVTNYESELKAVRDASRKQFVEKAKADGKLLPKDENLVTAIFESISQLEDVHEYKVDGGKTEKATVDGMIRAFIGGLPNLVDLQERSKSAGDVTEIDKTKKPGDEVERIVNEYIEQGKAKDFHGGLALLKKEHSELWKSYMKGEETKT